MVSVLTGPLGANGRLLCRLTGDPGRRDRLYAECVTRRMDSHSTQMNTRYSYRYTIPQMYRETVIEIPSDRNKAVQFAVRPACRGWKHRGGSLTGVPHSGMRIWKFS